MIHPRDGVPTLDHPIHFIPRFQWGDYEALSYTWGDDKRSGSIFVNGKLIPVQRNVENALRRLRALPETRHGMKYWIDAICTYLDQHRTEDLRDLRCEPPCSEGFRFASQTNFFAFTSSYLFFFPPEPKINPFLLVSIPLNGTPS
jgi:hypothetical protein